MGRYRNSEEPYKDRVLASYRDRRLGNYFEAGQHSKPYLKPKPARSYSKPSMGGGRGRLDRNSKPEYFQSPKPEQKYETVVKSEKMSSPLVEKTLRYRFESDGNQAWVDTDQVNREVERRIDGKLEKQFFEKFKDELEKLSKEAEKTTENTGKLTESATESGHEAKGVERHSENGTRNGEGQMDEARTEMIEGDGGSSSEEKNDADVAIEGGFVISRALGVAVPTEADKTELEQAAQESKEQETEVVENVETQTEQETDESELGEIDDAETESPENAEAEAESSEVDEGENTEDMQVEDRKTDEAIPEEAAEAEETTSELLPEESDLYLVEEEPTEIV